MDDQQIALMMINASSLEILEYGITLFKQAGYSKNRIKRILFKELKKQVREGWKEGIEIEKRSPIARATSEDNIFRAARIYRLYKGFKHLNLLKVKQD